LLLFASRAHAKPQWNTGVEAALCGRGSRLGLSEPAFCGAVHGDVLLLAKRGSDVAFGPSLRLGSAAFDDFRIDLGASLLLPVFDSFPLVIDAGPHLRDFDEPGVFASVFFGLRSFNHYGHYQMASGIVVTAERTFALGSPSALWIGARVDGAWLALPFLLGYNALK
jgi:hypothetical protein